MTADERVDPSALPAVESGALVSTRTEGHVRYLTMERPSFRNALSDALKIGLVDAVEAYESDDWSRVLILCGCDCGAFSAGGDLRRVAGRLERGLPIADPEVPDLFQHLTARKKPIIAAIDGYALGGGFEMALACDIRVATESSRFGLPEPRAGMLAQYGLDHLSRLIPLGEAMRLQLTGGQIGARRAYDIGLVQEVCDTRAKMFDAAKRLADGIVRCSPRAVQTIRHVVTVGRNLPASYAESFSQPYRDAVHSSADALEGARAFLEKRQPRWVTEST
jgi:enoyl-CoA hydratase/carnithine racemase